MRRVKLQKETEISDKDGMVIRPKYPGVSSVRVNHVPSVVVRWLTFLLMGILFNVTMTCAATCEARFAGLSFDKIKSGAVELPLGSKVHLTITDGGSRETSVAYFLGLSHHEDAYFFYDAKTEKIFSVEMDALRIRSGKRTPEITGTDIRIKAPEITIPVQLKEDCSIHATVNCIGFLGDQELIDKTNQLVTMRDRLYDIFKDVDAEHYEQRLRQAQQVNKSQGAGFWNSLFSNAQVENQPQLRSRKLAFYGLPNDVTFNENKLMHHLAQGYPAILDVTVKFTTREQSVITATGIHALDSIKTTKPSSADQAIGSHAVVAIGFIKTGFFSKKILVLDSAHGGISVWDPQDLKKYAFNTYTLVYPNKESYQKAGHSR